MKISLICTVFNEAGTIKNFLDSILIQTKKPYELVIVDGASTDQTINEIIDFQKTHGNKLKIKLIKKKGNRSVGRNTAIKNSTSEIILCSDAGCILDKAWIENITKPFTQKDVDVVAGTPCVITAGVNNVTQLLKARPAMTNPSPTPFLTAN